MLREAKNSVRIEGILNEIDLDYGTYTDKNTKRLVDCIRGRIVIKTKETINGEEVELEIPVYMFSPKLTKENKPHTGFAAIEKVKNEFISVAACGDEDKADRVRITNGKLVMNEYPRADGTMVSYPRVNATFVQKVKKEDYSPEARFSAELVIGSMGYETDKEGIETGRFKIMGIIPQYRGEVDVLPFYAISENVINVVSGAWQPNETVDVIGKLNFTYKTEKVTTEVDFGEPVEETRTTSVSELVIVGGRESPLDGTMAYDIGEIQEALNARKRRLDESKTKAMNRPPKATNTVSSAAKASEGLSSLGF